MLCTTEEQQAGKLLCEEGTVNTQHPIQSTAQMRQPSSRNISDYRRLLTELHMLWKCYSF